MAYLHRKERTGFEPAREACVSAVPPPPHSSIILFLKEMPRKNSMFLFIEPIEEKERGWENPAFSFFIYS